MRNGYTTGTTACASAVGACLLCLENKMPECAVICLPDGSYVKIPVFKDDIGVFAVKDGGDDIDVTHGMRIYASVVLNDTGLISIKGGQGIGTVTRKGLQIPVGQSAINPVPLKMIRDNLAPLLGGRGAEVTIFAPDGERIAKETFNEKVGVTGGISIIGSTGIVTPMSTQALIDTIKCEIDVASAENIKNICLTPGKIGEKSFKTEFPDTHVILMSNYAYEAFSYAGNKGYTKIYTAGHPSKLLKILMGYYNTHSKQSPMAVGFLAERLGLKDEFNTVEEILDSVSPDLSPLALELAQKIEKDFGFEQVSVIFYDMKGKKHGERL